MHRAPRVPLSLVFTSLAATLLSAQAPSIYQRPIGATATVTGSPKLRDGLFQLTGTAAMCGVIPKEASMTGEATFVIETSDGITGTMTTLTFGSKQLAETPAGAGRFTLTVGMETANGGRPPNYVLNTEPPRPGNSGTATLTTVKGISTLKVVGRNEANESIELNVTCR
jgi:hypothetical protein